MELPILNPQHTQVGKRKLPTQFSEELRPDMILRAFLSLMGNRRQPYGSDPIAGMRHSVRISKRRRAYRGSYGKGISRTPRKIHVRRGSQMMWTGAAIPPTVGGRRAHPPKAEKQWGQKLNTKERRKSLRSAISATLNMQLIKRQHTLPEGFPFLLSKDFDAIGKTKEAHGVLTALGFADEFGRAKQKKIRAGRGKMRGRKYARKKGLLIVVAEACNLEKALKNIEGIDIIDVSHLNIELLAPGARPGRLTLWSESAIEKMEKDKLFM